MKNQSIIIIKLISIIAFLILHSCNFKEETDQAESDGQENVLADNESKNTESLADAVKKFKPCDYSQPAKLNYIAKDGNYLVDAFRPIGWSADGKFAFITEYADEASGGYFINISIQDMTTNKIVWKWEYFDDAVGENLNVVWNREYTKFKDTLNSFAIEQYKNTEISKGSIVYNKAQYQLNLETETQTDPDFGFQVVTEYKLMLEKSGQAKQFYTHKEDTPSMILGAIVVGYIQSPNAELIAVLYQKERRGYEGPPSVVMFSLAGCDLSKF